MKIKNIYNSCDNFGKLTLVKNNSFKRIEKFFEGFPVDYSTNYFYNKNSLKIYEMDRVYLSEDATGLYDPFENIICVSDIKDALTHELIHMCSCDRISDKNKVIMFGEYKNKSEELYLISEGITEFLSALIDKREVDAYNLECFVSRMLFISDESMLKYYFNADNYGFLYKLYDEKELMNILYNLSYIVSSEYVDTPDEYRKSFHVLLNSLLNRELSKEKSAGRLLIYRDLFLELLKDEEIKDMLKENYKDYHNYARRLVDNKFGIRKW